MVDALREVRAVLSSDGVLIDLRPLVDEPVVEVVSAREARPAGHAKQTPTDLEHDEAANRAIEAAGARGWFRFERRDNFPFFYYWDSPSEMRDYLEQEWEDSIALDEHTWEQIGATWAVADADARLRMPLNMTIARWQASSED
jgi:hypothetical protein